MFEQSQFDDFRVLGQRWMEARKGEVLARYEELVVGSLGALSDEAAILTLRNGEYEILSFGPEFSGVLGWRAGRGLNETPENFLHPLARGLDLAFKRNYPQFDVVTTINTGMITAVELLVFPMTWRHELIAMLLIRKRPVAYNLLDAIYSASSDGLLVLMPVLRAGEIDYQIVSLNDAAQTFLQTGGKAAQWRMVSEFLTPRELAFVFQRLGEIGKGASPQFEFERRGPRGSVYLRASVVRLGELFALTLSNISDIKLREASIRRLFDSNPIPHILYEPASLAIMQANDAAARAYGYSRDAFARMTLEDLHRPGEASRVREIASRQKPPQGAQAQYVHITADGRLIDVMVYSREVRIDDKSCVLASIVDVTEQHKAEQRILHMAQHDHLTSLANRVLFRSRLDEGLTDSARDRSSLAVHCLDLDHFKHVNDTLGHPIGDTLLREVAARLTQTVRTQDLVARLGGDEFAIIQFGLETPEDAAALAERVITALNEPLSLEGQEVRIGTSVGIAISPRDGLGADDLLKNADIALYRAKLEARNAYRFFVAEMDQRLQQRRGLELDLRKALQLKQFSLFYQPLYDAKQGRITACEALIRWNHPERGAVPPSEFIGLAEETGQITQIGEWVLYEACREAAAWPDDVVVAVNLSPVQFRCKDLVETVEAALNAADLPAQRLELEVTETVFLGENESNVAVLTALRAMGVSIALDDFGTGYSSLSYLRSFPFDKIKIDRSFVADLGKNPDSAAIIRAISALGRSLGISTVAEGVETQAQADHLQAEGLNQLQGFLFSPPEPAHRIRVAIADNGRSARVA